MGTKCILGANDGMVIAEKSANQWKEVDRNLTGHRVTSLTTNQDVILAGTTEGIFLSTDRGKFWREFSHGLSIRHVRWLAVHPDNPDLAFAGTEPAGIFVALISEEVWQAKQEVAELRDHHRWFLPYSPEAGCVRGFAFHGDRVLAAVEVGGVLRSDDKGTNWRLAPGSSGAPRFGSPQAGEVHPDVHSIAVHPSSSDLVFAPTGGGFYRSTDGGVTWQRIHPAGYVRAVWVDPADPGHMVLGPASSVDRNGSIEETHDGGTTWHAITEGSGAPWSHHMVERFSQIGDELWAVLSNGEVFASQLAKLTWRQVLPAVKKVNAVVRLG